VVGAVVVEVALEEVAVVGVSELSGNMSYIRPMGTYSQDRDCEGEM